LTIKIRTRVYFPQLTVINLTVIKVKRIAGPIP